LNANIIRRLTGGQAGTYLTRGSVVGSNFAVMIALAALLSPDEFGRLVYLWTFALVLSAVGTIGASAYFLREFSALLGRGDGAPRFNTGLLVLLGLILPAVVIGGLIGALIFLARDTSMFAAGIRPTTGELLATGVVAWLANAITNLASLSRVLDQVNLSMAMRDASAPMVLLIATLAAIAIHGDAPGVVAIFQIHIAIAAALVLGWWGQIFVRDGRINRLLAWRRIDGFPDIFGLWGMQASNAFSAGIDVMAGGLFLGEAQLGYYQLVKRIANLAALPQMVANWAVIVALGKAHGAQDRDGIAQAVRQGARITLMPLALLLPLSAAVIAGVTYWLGYPMDATALATALLLLAAAATHSFFCSNGVLVQQTGLEYHALAAQLGGLALFGACTIAFLTIDASPALLALAQWLAILAAALILWRTIRKRLGVDSSLLVLLERRDGGGG
jgi:O-antigen/teichoic acid export membrane protein